MSLQPKAAKGTRKVVLKPGRSLLNWITYCSSKPDLSSFHPKPKPKFITSSQLKEHNKVKDCWMCIQDVVYNLTPYMEYHPGGIEELMRGAGKDGTSLFMEVHKWVNYPKLLSKCLIAPIVKIPASPHDPELEGGTRLLRSNGLLSIPGSQSTGANKSLIAPDLNTDREEVRLQARLESSRPEPRINFSCESKDPKTLLLRLHSEKLRFQHGFVARITGQSLHFLAYLHEFRYRVHVEFVKPIKSYSKVDWTRAHIGTIEISIYFGEEDGTADLIEHVSNDVSTIGITKPSLPTVAQNISQSLDIVTSASHPPSHLLPDKLLFRPLDHHGTILSSQDFIPHMSYHTCQLVERVAVTHDTYLMKFEFPNGVSAQPPIGYHVFMRLELPIGVEMTKPYTPIPTTLFPNTTSPTRSSNNVHASTPPAISIVPLSHKILSFLVKVYTDGPFSQALNHLKLGDAVSISDFEGNFDEEQLSQDRYSRLILLAAGSGITPILGILNTILPTFHPSAPISDSRDKGICKDTGTKSRNQTVVLLFFNKTEDDIIWDKKLKRAANANPLSFRYVSILSQPRATSDWEGAKGRVSTKLLSDLLRAESIPSSSSVDSEPAFVTESCYACVCGSVSFNAAALSSLKGMGVSESNVFTFS